MNKKCLSGTDIKKQSTTENNKIPPFCLTTELK